MKIAICDGRITKSALDRLGEYADSVILLPAFSKLPEPVSGHPDMLMFPFWEQGLVLTHPDYCDTLQKLLAFTCLEIRPITERVTDSYPGDILLNGAMIGKNIFGRLDSLSEEIISNADKLGFSLHNVRQGYAKCSVCTLSDNALITADKSIAIAAESAGIEALRIREGHVALDGYSFGFIGGASGLDGENVFFCGDINTHPDGEIIEAFCHKHGRKAVSLSNELLYDVGTIFFTER